jgi:glycosyltransferase involved in cell wall biosynthesis
MADGRQIAIALDYPLTLRGGVSVIAESLLKHLPVGYNVVLSSPDDPEELKKHACASRLNGHICFNPANLTPASARNLVEAIRRHNVSLVHFHAGANLGWGNRSGRKSPLPSLSRAGIPCLFSAHQVSPLLEGYCAENRPLWYKLALLPAVWSASTYALFRAARIVTDSQHDARLLKRNFPLLSRKIDFIYHSRLNADHVESLNEMSREKIILSVGHVAFRKGQHILAEAFSQIAPLYPEWKLVIAGPVLQDDCGKKIEQIRTSNNLGDRIELRGSEPEPQKLMRQASIFVQPSLMEALGLALQEAMFFGCACVGSNVGGIPELITHNHTGMLFPAGQIDALAEVLAELIRQPDRRLQLAGQAHASIVARGMTGQAMASNYDKLYQRFFLQHRE